MSDEEFQTRTERRAALIEERRAERKRTQSVSYQAALERNMRVRKATFGLIVVAVLGVGLYLAGGAFLGQRGTASTADAVPVRLSMAGFDPKVITVKAGAEVNLDFWNQDNAMHLDGGGVHTFIMPEYQNIYVKIPAEARQAFAFTAPATPGDYDFYCDTCCGGKESPTMHGTLRVEPASA
jgi:heme/copper-type cytochrome/quinol oxidase subunit 2